MRKVHLVQAGEANIGPKALGHRSPWRSVPSSDELRKRQGDRGSSPRGLMLRLWGDSASPLFDQEQLEVAVLRKRESSRPVNRVGSTEQSSGELASSVRRPLKILFEPPASPSTWHMTGRINWPSPHQSCGIGLTCDWANDHGMRIWLPAQHRHLVVEFTDRAEGWWRGLAMRSRRFVAGVVRRSRLNVLGITLCYLHLVADFGIW